MGFVYLSWEYFNRTKQDDIYYYTTVTVKFCCIFAIHVMQQPAIFSSINRIGYVLRHPDNFENLFFPVMFALMKLTIEFSIEWVCIYATAFENLNVYTIMDFSALIVINYLDQ